MPISTQKRREQLEMAMQIVTDVAVRGSNMVPSDYDLPVLRSAANDIFRLSGGRNKVLFDKLGRPWIGVWVPCDEKARLAYLSGGATYFSDSEYGTGTNVASVHDAFIVNDSIIRGFWMGKFPDVRVNSVNYHLSLYNLAPAYGTGGVTESYNGLASACDTANAGTDSKGVAVHNITDAEFAYLGLRAVRDGFQCRGSDNYGKSQQVSTEQGDPCLLSNGQYLHVRTGSGPNAWYHNGSPLGIWGLRGPVAQICHGYITKAGEMLFIPNNNAASLAAADLAETSTQYKGVLQDSSLVAQGTADDLKLDFVNDISTQTIGSFPFEICTSLTHQQVNTDVYGSNSLATLGARSGVTIPLFLRLRLRAPLLAGTPSGTQYMRNGAGMTRCSIRGAYYGSGSGGGFGYSNGYDWPLGSTGNGGGGRVVSLEK
ncbi:MAG: hypothetical protein WCS71_06620 [Sphaerochaetaceae bacterium]